MKKGTKYSNSFYQVINPLYIWLIILLSVIVSFELIISSSNYYTIRVTNYYLLIAKSQNLSSIFRAAIISDLSSSNTFR